jgi:hypothetical protein
MDHRTETRRRRPFTRYVAFALIVLMTPIFALATAVAVTGTVTVSVHEKGPDGTRIYVPVPALLLDAAVALAPMVIPDEDLAEARREIAPYRDSLAALAAELEDMPAGVLVEVESRDEHVLITKTWRSFEISVESADTDVQVSVPARLLSRVLDVL